MQVAREGLIFKFEGYGDPDSVDSYGQPILIEFYAGHLRVLCWDNINVSDCTVIDMELARESNRRESNDA